MAVKVFHTDSPDRILSKDAGVLRSALLPQNIFLKKNKISKKDFDKTRIKWSELEKIHKDFLKYKRSIEDEAKEIVEVFMTEEAKSSRVHSVRFRIKNPDTLIEKIIRKKIESIKQNKRKRNVTVDNYCEEITDMIGIRVLHVFKSDWQSIHQFIEKQGWEHKEAPKVYYRKGDPKEFIKECKKHKCVVEAHPKAYRSIHYIIKQLPKNICHAEIQVRTIFEEGWSEIDHKLRYFIKSKRSHVLDKYLLALNRVAGSADEIGYIINQRHSELQQEAYEKQVKVKNNNK